MNNFMYPLPGSNYHQLILEQLNKINETLSRIEKKIDGQNNKKENKYLEKDDNYYMI